MPDGVVVTDARGQIVYVSRLLARMSGYSPEGLVGEHIETLVPERLRGAHEHHRDEYHQGGRPVRPMGAGLEITLCRSDGTEIPVDIALSTLQVAGAEPMTVAAVRDITERRLAEATIRETERRWSELLQNVHLMVLGLDLEGRVNFANPFLLRSTGWHRDDVMGQDVFELFIAAEDRAKLTSIFEEILEAERHPEYENRVRARDGRMLTVSWFNTVLRDPSGAPLGTLSIGEDVTERRRGEARLRAINEVAQAMLTGGSIEGLLHQVASSAARLVDADVGALITPIGGTRFAMRAVVGELIEQARGREFDASGYFVEEVIETGRSVIIEDLQTETRAPNLTELGPIGPGLLVALWVRGNPFGLLFVGNAVGGRALELDDAVEVEAFAGQAAVALAYGEVQQELQRLGVLAERERIARELHDTVIQRLFAAGMRLQAAVSASPQELNQRIEEVTDDLDGVIRDIRSTIFVLEATPRRGLRTDVLDAVAEAGRVLGFEPYIRLDGAIDAGVPDELHEHVLAALREALSNVARHANASRVHVQLTADDELCLRVVDDGVGLDGADGDGGGLGLRNMRERAEKFGGSFDLRGGPGRGTIAEWTVPLRASG